MKRSLCLLLLLARACFPQPAWSQQATIPLDLQGPGVAVVKVDKIITVKVDMTVVQSFPFTVKAPSGSSLYFWSLPAGVTSIDNGDQCEITSAPKGACTISVKAISPDLDKDGKFKGFLTAFGRVSFTIGDVPGPVVPPVVVPPVVVPPDVPPAPPMTTLETLVANAFAKETDPNRLEYAKQLAALYRSGIPYANDAAVKTPGALFAMLTLAERKLADAGALPQKCLPAVKTVITAELNRTLLRNPLAAFDAGARATAATEFGMIATALEKLK